MNDLLEKLAALEHEQWMDWSRNVAPEVSDERRQRWEKYWVPYSELPEGVKDPDRFWARKSLELLQQEIEFLESEHEEQLRRME